MRVQETVLALLTVAILFFVPARLKRYLPPQLLALVVVTLASIAVLGSADIRRIGEISTALPELRMPVFSVEQWQIMLLDAVVLGMLGCIDALLTSVVADSLTRTQHNSNKELIGQGIGNVMSGLFGGLPGAGATMGTVVNIQAGARTALSGVVRAGILLVVVLWAARLTAVIPLAVLAGIALKVGIDIIDWGFLKRAHRLSGKGAIITYGVITLTVFVDLIAAVGIGLFVANIMTVTRLSELQADDVKAVTDPQETDLALTPDERKILSAAAGRVLLLHLRGAMIFGTSRVISRKNSEVEGIRTLIVDVTDVVYLGVSAALAIEEAILDMIRCRAFRVCGCRARATSAATGDHGDPATNAATERGRKPFDCNGAFGIWRQIAGCKQPAPRQTACTVLDKSAQEFIDMVLSLNLTVSKCKKYWK